MKDLNQIRLITVTYANYQGLKAVPLGLLLTTVSLWGNAGTGPRRDVLFPGACVVVAFLLYWLIARYYDRTYGTVQATPAQRRSEILRGLIGGSLGLAIFVLDVSLKPAVSLIGLLMVTFGAAGSASLAGSSVGTIHAIRQVLEKRTQGEVVKIKGSVQGGIAGSLQIENRMDRDPQFR